ncbi:MAG: GntR family transcriptional regulator [Armatimonadota bacterium]|nr:GntR family transcriptional regulator [Armatimonadota bacterium]MDR5696298.1 GntR family transcriptional regulator [Armatimonadota bacterium]
MEFDLQPHLPLTDQLKEQIAYQILSGRLRPGDRLPPVRTLASFLRVNRNTVARAYRELRSEGYLDAAPGRGTRVSGRRGASAELRVRLTRFADEFLSAGRAAGLSIEDLKGLLAARARSRQPTDGGPDILFVECNPSDLRYFTRVLSAALGLPVRGALLSDAGRAARRADVVCTTFFHVEEVQAALPGREVVGLVALPDFDTLERVARLPKGTSLAVVCATEEGARSKERSIRAVGIRGRRITSVHLGDPRRLARAIAAADVVIASPKVLERLRLPPDKPRIVFASVLLDGAVSLLRERIETWRRTCRPLAASSGAANRRPPARTAEPGRG